MMTKRMFTLASLAAGALALAVGGALGTPAAQAAGYYEGKTVVLVVPHSTTGGYGRYSKLIAPYIEKELKADSVRIEHHRGAGGLVGTNLVWRAEPDGLTIGFSSGTSLLLTQLAGGEGVQFDALKFTYLGRAASVDRVIFVGANSPIKTVDDVLELGRPFRMPSQGTDDDFYGMALVAHTLGFDVQYITGYEGSADTTLAVVKGDGDGRLTSWTSALSPIKAGDARPWLTLGTERHPDYPEVPTAIESAKSDAGKKTLRALYNIQSLHRSFFGPEGIPEEVAAEMRDAIGRALANPELLAAAEKSSLPINAMHGSDQQKLVAEIYEASASIPPVLEAAQQSIK